LSGNNVTANIDTGIYLQQSSDSNTLSGNNIIANSAWGVYLDSSSDSNTLSGNNITNNHEGIELLYSTSNNAIYDNNFINNTYQVDWYSSTNVWDNGNVGNYWSDYLTRYPNATQVDNSGVWNTPYQIDDNNYDLYPLAVPYAVIPEFPSFLILSLFLITILLAVIIYKKKATPYKRL
jgi:parallel beta-helix repeat protein